MTGQGSGPSRPKKFSVIFTQDCGNKDDLDISQSIDSSIVEKFWSSKIKTVAKPSTFFLRQRPSNDVLSDIIILGKIKQFSDFASSLRSKATRNGLIGKARNILFS